MHSKKYVFFIVAIITAAVVYLALFGVKIGKVELTGSNQMRFGIDIRGGVEAMYEPKDLDRSPTAAELSAARAVIETRLDAKNISDRDVTTDETNGKIIVRFPWKSDEKDFNPQQAVAELGETAKLTFRDPDGNVVVEGTQVKESSVGTDPQTNLPPAHLDIYGRDTHIRADRAAADYGRRSDNNQSGKPGRRGRVVG